MCKCTALYPKEGLKIEDKLTATDNSKILPKEYEDNPNPTQKFCCIQPLEVAQGYVFSLDGREDGIGGGAIMEVSLA